MIVLIGGFAVMAIGWIAFNFRVAVVNGQSMEPTLRDNDRVLVRRIGPHALRRGDIVLARMPTRTGWIVKRVAALPGDPGLAGSRVPAGMLVLLGDNPAASADSRDFGYVPADRLFGVVLRKVAADS